MNKMNLSGLIRRMASVLLLLLLMTYRADTKLQIVATTVDFQVGSKMLLLCKVEQEGDITWLKDGEDVEEDLVKKVDETSSKVVIERATMEDAGVYTCNCDFGGHTDHDTKRVFIHDGPHFGQTPLHHDFVEGSSGWVPCEVTGEPEVVVQWLRQGMEISPTGSRVRQLPNNTLFFNNVTRRDAGIYVCKSQIRNRPVYNNISISVVVSVPPTVHLKEKEINVVAGSRTNVSLLCLVDGSPKPTINWTMPREMDPSHYWFNSDRSQLTIMSVVRADNGEYVCTATNKLNSGSDTVMLNVHEAPEVFLSTNRQSKSVGDRVSVSCNVSGHPQPKLFWHNKHTGHTVDSASGRVRVVDGSLMIEDIVPSDGGVYSCMAVSATGNASRDFEFHTEPDVPHYLSVSPGPSSVLFSVKVKPTDGGTPITSFVLQWRQNEAEEWKEITIPESDPLSITDLKQYTTYTVRLAAMNAVGKGHFSAMETVRTMGKREPDSPVLLADKMKVEKNSFTIPLQQADEGMTPLRHFTVRYKQSKEGADWKEIQLSPSEADSISLQDLPFGSDYQLEVIAVNDNGSSIPGMFNFTIGPQPSSGMTKGTVVGIVLMIFLVVFLVVDASCCYKNHCGLLMSIAVKLFGQKVPGLKMLEDGEAANNGEIKLKGIPTPRGSMQLPGTLTKESGELTEVTCDKVSLTKHEKSTPGRDLHHADV